MATHDSLKSLVRQYIKTNGQNEITGQILQNVLIAMIDELGITIDPTPTKNSSDAVSSGGTFGALQQLNEINATLSGDGKIYNNYQAGDIYYTEQNSVRVYWVALADGEASEENPVTISDLNFYHAENATDAVRMSLSTKTFNIDAYTKQESDAKYQPKGNYQPAGDYATEQQLAGKANASDVYTKSETYSKAELDNLITTPNQQYVSVTATAQTTAITDLLPATGAADTIYRVGNWDGTQYDPTMYALFAWNGTTYVCLAVRSFVGEVYDVSVNHPDGQGNPTPYADLTTALGTSGANIPADIRRGGMSIKFIQGNVQSSDNKYVQYFLTKDEWSITESDWEKLNLEQEIKENDIKRLIKKPGKNILDLDGIIDGFLYSNGTIEQSDSFSVSKFIPVEASTRYTATRSDLNPIGGGASYHVFYNEDFSVIGSSSSNETYFDTPSNAVYARFTIRNTALALLPMVNAGDSRGDYVPFDALNGYTTEIRNTITKIEKSAIPELSVKKLAVSPGVNLLNLEGLENGGLNANGVAESSTSFSHTVFIPLKPSTQYSCRKSDNDNFGGGGYQHCFYDKNFNLVHTVASTSTHFTTQETVAYAKFTIRNTSLALLPMVNEGNARGNYEPYDALFGYTGVIRGEISGIKQNYVPVSLSKNLLDVASLSVGFLYENGSENNINNNYRKSGYIPVSEGNYYLSAFSQNVQGSNVPIFAFYNANKEYIGKQQWSTTESTGVQISVPSGASFARLTLYTASIDDSLQFEAGTQRTSYVPYSLVYGYNKEILNDICELTPAKNSVGKDGLSASAATLSNGSLTISGFPQYIKSNGIVSGGGKITQFNQVIVGYGYGETFGKYAKVDATNIILCSTASNGTERVVETVAHNLTISEFIDVVLSIDGYVVTVIVSTLGGYKTITHTYTDVASGNGLVESMSRTPSIVADSTTSLTNVSIRTTSDSFRLPIWVFGDSYTSQNTERWPYYARYQFGINALWIGVPGGQSTHLFPDLEKALSFGCPKFLVWCLGMNDSYVNYQSYFAKVKGICEQYGIELIAGTIPLVPLSGYADKNEDINDYIKASGVRYIDFAASVGADTTSTWYDGCLSNDDIHPTAKGAKCLFAGAFKDFPEMMQYGIQPK